jgi:hypothetical protein
MFDTQINLDDYRSVEELQRLAIDVQDEMVAMERESDGRPAPMSAPSSSA